MATATRKELTDRITIAFNKIMELHTSSSEINRQIDKVGNMFMNGGGGPAFSSY